MMESKTLFPIAKITKAFGFKGEVGLHPLVMQYDDYLFKKQLSIGLNEKSVKKVNIIKTSGSKKKKLLFSGLKSRDNTKQINWKLYICASFNWRSTKYDFTKVNWCKN